MSFFKTILNENHDSISGLTEELKAIYIQNQYHDNSIIVISNTLYEANMLYQRLKNYTDKVLFFPMDDFLTSEALAISPEFKTTRLETIDSILKNNHQIIVTNLMGYLRYLPKKELFKNKILSLKINEDYNMKELINQIHNLGYIKETITSVTGNYSTRGFVIDIFPIKEEHPIRLEFWGDTLDSIKYYDENTQMTLTRIDEIKILPNTEFLAENNDEIEKHYNLSKYTSVVNINDYLDN